MFFLLVFTLVPITVFGQTEEKEGVSFVVFGHVYPDYEAVEKSIEKVNELNPDFVIFNGDTLPSSHHVEWDYVKNITDNFNAPVYFVPGNHDIQDRADDKKKFIENIGPLSQVFEVNSINFVILNSVDIDAPLATYDLSGEQVVWLEESIDEDMLNIIFVHNCLFFQDENKLCNNKGQVIGENNNWNLKAVPILNSVAKAVFVGDVGTKQPYISYSENGVQYYGVGFSRDRSKTPQHFLSVSIKNDNVIVEPVVIFNELSEVNSMEKLERKTSFRETMPKFSYERLRMIVIVYLKKITALLALSSFVLFLSSVYFYRKSRRNK